MELTTISQNGSLICHPKHHALVAVQTARRSAILPMEAHLERHLLRQVEEPRAIGAPRQPRGAARVPARCSPSGDPAPARTSAPRHLPLPAALRAGTSSATPRAGHSCAVQGKGLISPVNSFSPARRWGRAHARCHGCRRSTQKVAGVGRGEGVEPPAGAECPPGAALRARGQLLPPRWLNRPPAAYGWRRRRGGREGGRKGINFKVGRAGREPHGCFRPSALTRSPRRAVGRPLPEERGAPPRRFLRRRPWGAGLSPAPERDASPPRSGLPPPPRPPPPASPAAAPLPA